MPIVIKHQLSVVGVVHVHLDIIVGGGIAGREASVAGQQRDLGIVALLPREQLNVQLGGIFAGLYRPIVDFVF